MKIFSIIITVITGLLLISTLICGLWIKAKNLTGSQSSLNFHMQLGIVTVIFAFISIVLLFILAVKR